MADLREIPEWLARKISQFIKAARSGQVALNFTQGRVQSFDLREHGRVEQNGTDEKLEN
jgi:hypothetical protein